MRDSFLGIIAQERALGHAITSLAARTLKKKGSEGIDQGSTLSVFEFLQPMQHIMR